MSFDPNIPILGQYKSYICPKDPRHAYKSNQPFVFHIIPGMVATGPICPLCLADFFTSSFGVQEELPKSILEP